MKLLSLFRLRRRPAAEPWPRNVRTVADDLREAYERLAVLASKLTDARQRADVAAARIAAAEERADHAEQRAQELAELLAKVRADRDGLRRQLDNALYDSAALATIDAGTGQPRKA